MKITVLNGNPETSSFDSYLGQLRIELEARGNSVKQFDLRDLDFDSVERALSLLDPSRVNVQVDLALGVRAFCEQDFLYLAAWEADLPFTQWPQMPGGSQGLELPLPGRVDLPNGWVLKAEIIEDVYSAREAARDNQNPYRAWLDVGETESDLKVRRRRSGDRFQPLGLHEGSTKLTDFMINVKISRRARKQWPLVCIGEKIVWVPGFRPSHAHRLKTETKRVVYLQLSRSV